MSSTCLVTTKTKTISIHTYKNSCWSIHRTNPRRLDFSNFPKSRFYGFRQRRRRGYGVSKGLRVKEKAYLKRRCRSAKEPVAVVGEKKPFSCGGVYKRFKVLLSKWRGFDNVRIFFLMLKLMRFCLLKRRHFDFALFLSSPLDTLSLNITKNLFSLSL